MEQTLRNQKKCDEFVAAHLKKIGIPENTEQYNQLKEAIILVVQDPALISNLVRGVYDEVAKKFGKSSAIVQRDIKNAIKKACEKSNLSVLKSYLGNRYNPNKVNKLTNGEFIFAIAEKILEEEELY